LSEKTAIVLESFYDARNRHEAAGIAAAFATRGLYADPLTRVTGPISDEGLASGS
jgi:hypothetical protein